MGGYGHQTKGEMLRGCTNPALLTQLVDALTSCGRYSRTGFQHCRRCVPCQVRRGAFLTWGRSDSTTGGYNYGPLGQNDARHARFDDMRSVAIAIETVRRHGIDALIGGAMNRQQRWTRLFGQFLGLNKLYPVVVMPPF